MQAGDTFVGEVAVGLMPTLIRIAKRKGHQPVRQQRQLIQTGDTSSPPCLTIRGRRVPQDGLRQLRPFGNIRLPGLEPLTMRHLRRWYHSYTTWMQ